MMYLSDVDTDTQIMVSAIEEWLNTPKLNPRNTLGWFVKDIFLTYDDNIYHYNIRIRNNYIDFILHGKGEILKAEDPEFFNKLHSICMHIINFHSCERCKYLMKPYDTGIF